MSNYEIEKVEAFEELSYDLLNQVPLLGSLVKTFLWVHSTEQKKQFEKFAHILLQGADTDGDLIKQVEGKESEAFNTVFKTMASDFEMKKADIYNDINNCV